MVDVGCGTATQAIDMAARRPSITVIGVDGDSRVLELARRKPGAAPLDLRAGDATALPLEDGSAAAVEAHRVLRPGGRLQVEVMRRVRTVFGTLELLAAR